MKDVKYYLDQNKEKTDYRISEVRTESRELFFVHGKVETSRATDTKATHVTVYCLHDGKLGDSDFDVYESMDENSILDKIAKAVERAKLVFNEPYELPSDETLDEKMPTDLDKYDPTDLAAQIADTVFSCETGEGGSINALEVFLYKDTRRVRNSRGIDKSETSYRVMIEAIPTYTTEKESVELYEDYRFTFFDREKLKKEITEKMAQVKARYEAQKPATPMKTTVTLRAGEIRALLSELASGLNYGSVYMHANRFKVGDDLQEGGNGDRLNVTMKGIVEGSEDSSYFDADGTTLRDRQIIKDGVVTSYFGANRFGRYLGEKEITGDLRCCEVGKGSLTKTELEKTPRLDVVSMSGLQTDVYSDYIGGEIRLAYMFDGEKTFPVSGITMSGRLSEALASLRLTDDSEVEGAYKGPSRFVIKNMNVL